MQLSSEMSTSMCTNARAWEMGACVFFTQTVAFWIALLYHSAMVRKQVSSYRSTSINPSSFLEYCGSVWGKQIYNSPTAICSSSLFFLFLPMLSYRNYLTWKEVGSISFHKYNAGHPLSTWLAVSKHSVFTSEPTAKSQMFWENRTDFQLGIEAETGRSPGLWG